VPEAAMREGGYRERRRTGPILLEHRDFRHRELANVELAVTGHSPMPMRRIVRHGDEVNPLRSYSTGEQSTIDVVVT
jgi:hypothetical protein